MQDRPKVRLSAPEYMGVLFEKAGVRLGVAPRGRDYLLQAFVQHSGEWAVFRRGSRRALLGFASTLFEPALFEALSGLPDDPLDTGVVPYDGRGKRYAERPGRRGRAARAARGPVFSVSGELLVPGGSARAARPERRALPAGRQYSELNRKSG